MVNIRNEIYIIGDFNIDYSLKSVKKRYKLSTLESKFNIKQLINDFTRVTHSSSTIIDWIYTDSQVISLSGTLDINISDHLPVFLVRKKP